MKRLLLAATLAMSCIHARAEIPEAHAACMVRLAGENFEERIKQLKELERMLPGLLGSQINDERWFQMLQRYVSGLQTPLLITTITGGGSSKKSTIFSSIEAYMAGDMSIGLADRVSPSMYEAGSTRQGVLLLGEKGEADLETQNVSEAYQQLEARIPGISNRTWTEGSAFQSGEGVLQRSAHLPAFFGIMDTPGFDVNASDLESAVTSLSSSDVVIFSVSNNTMNNILNKEIMRKNFEAYGVRRMIIVVTDVSIRKEKEVFDSVKKLAAQIYADHGGEAITNEMPEGLLGVYIMPHNDDVGDGLAHPKFHPILKSQTERYPEFADLLSYMDRERKEIKTYALEKASGIIIGEASRQVAIRVRQALAAEVHLEVAKRAQAKAVEASKFDFKAAEVAREMRRSLRKYDGKVGLVEELFDLFTLRPAAEKTAAAAEAALDGLLEKLKVGDLATTSSLSKGISVHVSEAIRPIFQPLISLVEKDGFELPISAELGSKLAIRYQELHGKPQSDDQKTVSLPKLSALDRSTKDAIDQLLTVTDPPFDAALETELKTQFFLALSNPPNAAGLFGKRSKGEALFERGMKVAIVGGTVLIVVSGHLYVYPIATFLGGYAGISTMNTIVGVAQNTHGERNKKDEAIKWIRGEMTKRLAAKTERLISSLEKQVNIGADALKVQEILKTFNPSFEILPTSLKEREDLTLEEIESGSNLKDDLEGWENPIEELTR